MHNDDNNDTNIYKILITNQTKNIKKKTNFDFCASLGSSPVPCYAEKILFEQNIIDCPFQAATVLIFLKINSGKIKYSGIVKLLFLSTSNMNLRRKNSDIGSQGPFNPVLS